MSPLLLRAAWSMRLTSPRAASSAFDDTFAATFGPRWPSLRAALAAPAGKVALAADAFSSEVDACPASVLPLPRPLAVRHAPDGGARSGAGAPYYCLDAASLLPPVALGVGSDDSAVLDACAAPGGKLLLLAQLLFAQRADGRDRLLVANELSQARHARLKHVVREFLPAEVAAAVRLSRRNSRRRTAPGHFGFAAHHAAGVGFDAVLVDAPCSSERHVLHQAGLSRGSSDVPRKAWSVARSRRNAQVQLELALSAVDSLRPGGRMVYSTCSISPRENQGVVAKLLRRRRGTCELGELNVEAAALAGALGAERCEDGLGWMVLPDATARRYGPMFVAVLRKADTERMLHISPN